MDYRNNAYGIGQRRVVNDAPSFAPIRGSGNGGGGGIDDNFRSPQSMNYGFNSNNSNNNNGNNSSNDFNFGNNNSQRFASMDSKFGNMQSNNYSRSSDNSGYGGGGGQNQQRFGNHTNSSNSSSGNFNDSNNYRGQMNQRSLGDQQQQQQQQRFNNMSDINRSSSSGDYSSSGYSSFRGSLQPPPQQPPQLGNLSLGRSINDQGYNNSNNNNDSNNGNQRFYNNDRNDTFRRADNFSDNFNRGQESINSSRSGGGGNNYKFNNDRGENFGRQVNNGGSNNFGYQNQNNQNRGGGGGFDDNFRGSNLNNHNFDNNNKNNQQQQQFFNNKQNGPRNGDSGFSNAQNFRGQNNSDMPIGGQALAAINETVNALMTNQSNWQVGNNNNGFGQGNFNGGGGGGNYRNNAGNRNNNNNNMNNAGNNRNFNNGPAQTGNWANNRSQQQQQQQQPRNFKPVNNKPQGAPVAARQGAAGGPAKFQGNKNQNQNQNQPKPNTNTNKPVVQQTNKKNVNATNNNKQQQPANQAVAKNVNGGQKPPQPKAAVPAKAAQNTQVKPKQETKKEAAVVNPKVAPKRPAPQPAAPLTKADIKRRKLALKRGFLLGGIKLPYVNSNRVALPQPEDKSYAVMFFEQSLNYSTSGEELDDDAEFDGPEAIPEATDAEGKNAGRTLVKRIRKRLHFEWTQVEESKKYKSWPTWWTDYKWCEKAIQEELETFGSVNLRNCFLPDLPRLTTEQVVDVIVKQAHFGLDKNSDNYFNNMKSILTLMNVTFLENLKMPNSEKVQDMIRAVPNDFWCYKMRSMVYLWAQYLKISKTSSPSTETGVKELQAIARDWKNPLFHWMAKQAYDELKAISEVEWPEHKQQYEELQSAAPTSS
ncbi:putative uncharacterized protein DDB_G0286901 [Drosophila albomicans]|uniref:Uncharacterized protein n=1 Tax=Drosophila albomicans TaxID=7291 RepID=A0A6P8W4B0_DROAB|nr:putative uncharacterized protein DDB_G0286901 [Drosophila albomicans]